MSYEVQRFVTKCILRANWEELKAHSGDELLWEALRKILDGTKRKFPDELVEECLGVIKRE